MIDLKIEIVNIDIIKKESVLIFQRFAFLKISKKK